MPLVLPRRSLSLDFLRAGLASGDNYPDELSKLDPLLTFSRASTATRFNSSGVLETVDSGQPRFDFDPITRAPKGLLLEQSRTNLLGHSALSSSTSWLTNVDGGSVTVEFVSDATFGNAMKLTCSAASGQMALLSQFAFSSVNSGQPYTGSLWVKAFAAGDVGKQILMRNVGLTIYSVYTLSDQWQRISSTEVAASSNSNFEFGLRPSEGGSSGTVTCLAVNAQLEAGAFATSYIPTTSTAVTRAQDLCSTTQLSPWWDYQRGTFLAEFTPTAMPANGSTNYHIFHAHNTDYASVGLSRVMMRFDGTSGAAAGGLQSDIFSAGSQIAIVGFGGSAVTPGVPIRASLAWGDGLLVRTAKDGSGIADTDPAVTPGSNINALYLGTGLNGEQPATIWLRRLLYLPYAVGDTTLNALTT